MCRVLPSFLVLVLATLFSGCAARSVPKSTSAGLSPSEIRAALPSDFPAPIPLLPELPWGSGADSLLAQMGMPSEVLDAGADTKLYRYEGSFLGASLVSLYGVHAEHGLLKASFFFDNPLEVDCEPKYEFLKLWVGSPFPLAVPEEEKFNKSFLDICGGASILRAAWITFWKDLPGSVTAGLYLNPGSSDIEVHYETPAFHTWRKSLEPTPPIR